MLTLYHAPRSRSTRFIWLLEELGAPYELKIVDIRRRDGSGAVDPANPHPHAKAPVIDHDGTIVFESTAIALYLAEAFPAAGLAPALGAPARGPFLTMLAYYCGVLEPSFLSKFTGAEVPRGAAGWVDLDEVMAYVRARLDAGAYICGDTFTAADTLYASTFALFLGQPLLPETPALAAYVERCTARPAYARAQAKDSG